MSRVLVVTPDTLGAQMAGPAIRAAELARVLSAAHDVRLVTTAGGEPVDVPFPTAVARGESLVPHERWADVLLVQGNVLHENAVLAASRKPIVVDVYDPAHLEQLEQAKEHDAQRREYVVRATAAIYNAQLVRGDFFLCASEKQRDFWLGQLAALGRVNTTVYDADPTLRSLIDVVPFGVPVQQPQPADHPVLRGVLSGIGRRDVVLLWGGGIYNWFDPDTLIRAVDRVRGNVRLVFLGTKHPNPQVPEMRVSVAARALADELGLTGVHVFFNDGWVPYAERAAYLLESDIGVSTHHDHVETAYSYRTRVLDYLWAGLPVVTTAGDALAGLVERTGSGVTVPPNDVGALAQAISTLASDRRLRQKYSRAAQVVAATLTWPTVAAPLLRFCAVPQRAPDHARAGIAASDLTTVPRPPGGWRRDVETFRAYWQDGGAALVARKAGERLRRITGRSRLR